MQKKTELASPSTYPPKNASDSANFRPRRFHGLSDACLMTLGENSESAALGVEGVLRKVRGERRRAATSKVEAVSRPLQDKEINILFSKRSGDRFHFRQTRFRNALSNRTRGRFSVFSPCQTRSTGIMLEAERRKTRIIGRIYSAVLTARFRSGLIFLPFRWLPRLP